MGREATWKIYMEDARESLEKAVEIDPSFAEAYYYLALAFNYLGHTKESDEAIEKAKSLSQKSTEKERLYIEASYARFIEHDGEKRRQILEQLVEKYPKEKYAHYRLGWYYQSINRDRAIEEYNKALELDPNFGSALNLLGYAYAITDNYEKAVEVFKRYVSVSPGEANPLDSLGDIYFFMGNLDDAILKYKEALEIKPDFHVTHPKIGYIYALKEEYAEAMKLVDKFIVETPSLGTKRDGYLWKGFYNYWLGNFKQSFIDLQRAEELTEAIGDEPGRAFGEWLKGMINYDRGNLEISRKYYKGWFDFCFKNYPNSRPSYESIYSFYVGFIELKEGNLNLATKMLAEMKPFIPELTPYQRELVTYFYNLLHAEILLAEGATENTFSAFEKVMPPRSRLLQYTDLMISYNTPFLKDGLARAYQKIGEIDKAIVAYEQLTTFNPDSKGRFLIHPLYHYRLAKLYEEKGWKGKAIEHYEIFLDLWRNADPGIADVDDAKKKLAGLQ